MYSARCMRILGVHKPDRIGLRAWEEGCRSSMERRRRVARTGILKASLLAVLLGGAYPGWESVRFGSGAGLR